MAQWHHDCAVVLKTPWARAHVRYIIIAQWHCHGRAATVHLSSVRWRVDDSEGVSMV